MDAYWILGMVMYLVVSTITGGVIQASKEDQRSWWVGESVCLGIIWPASLLWYLVFKPIAQLAMRLTHRQIDRRRVRIELREQQQREERHHLLEVDAMLVREEEEKQQAMRLGR